MGDIISWRRRQARPPLPDRLTRLTAKRASERNVTDLTPRLRAKAKSLSQLPDGMCSRAFQDETTDGLMPNSSAISLVPPNGASMSATERKRAMRRNVVRRPRTRQEFATLEPELATLEPTAPGDYAEISDEMSELKNLARRLINTRKALGLTQVEFCRQISVPKNIYNPFEKGRRRITVDIAIKIRRRFNIGLNWIYCGDLTDMPRDLSMTLGAPPNKSRGTG